MPSRRESFCRGRPPEIVIWVPKPRCACPVDCVRAVATPGSSAARSEAERPLRGRSVTLFELTTPVTPEAPPSPPLVLLSACITISARLTVPAITVTVVCDATKPFAVTRTSKTPGRRLRNEKEPSAFALVLLVSPFAVFFAVNTAFAIGAPVLLAIRPTRVPTVTWAFNRGQRKRQSDKAITLATFARPLF